MEKPASTPVFLCCEAVDTLRAGHAGDNMGVGCVKTLALIEQTISGPWCVERNTSNPVPTQEGSFPS